jgi:hypothetical protein
VLHPPCNSAEKNEKIKAYISLRQLKATVDSTVHWTLRILDCRLLKNLAAMTPILKQLQTALFAAALISITALNAAEKMGLPCRRSQMSQQCEGSHWEFLPASIRLKKKDRITPHVNFFQPTQNRCANGMGKTDCVKKLRVIELCEKIECESAVSDKERLCV